MLLSFDGQTRLQTFVAPNDNPVIGGESRADDHAFTALLTQLHRPPLRVILFIDHPDHLAAIRKTNQGVTRDGHGSQVTRQLKAHPGRHARRHARHGLRQFHSHQKTATTRIHGRNPCTDAPGVFLPRQRIQHHPGFAGVLQSREALLRHLHVHAQIVDRDQLQYRGAGRDPFPRGRQAFSDHAGEGRLEGMAHDPLGLLGLLGVPFVGRDDELTRAWSVLAAGGSARITGPWGVGRSRLGQHLMQRAAAAGVHVVAVRPATASDDPDEAPIGKALRDLLGLPGDLSPTARVEAGKTYTIRCKRIRQTCEVQQP